MEHNYFKTENSGRSEKSYQCHICPLAFKHNASLHNHLKGVHKVMHSGINYIKCLEDGCSGSFKRIMQLETHLSEKHFKKIDKEELTFESLKDFKTWKRAMEKNSDSQYVTYSPGRSSNVLYFKCSRSGFYKENPAPGTRKRRLKSQGSKKSGAYCISRIVAHIDETSGKISVNYCKTHYGHDMDLAHLDLNKIEKDKIADNLLRGVPINKILENVRSSANGNQLQRIHLLKRKDIKNIEKAYGINTNVERDTDDPVNVNSWVRELENSGLSPVILRKKQNEPRDGFDQEDFLLGLMDEAQSNILIVVKFKKKKKTLNS